MVNLIFVLKDEMIVFYPTLRKCYIYLHKTPWVISANGEAAAGPWRRERTPPLRPGHVGSLVWQVRINGSGVSVLRPVSLSFCVRMKLLTLPLSELSAMFVRTPVRTAVSSAPAVPTCLSRSQHRTSTWTLHAPTVAYRLQRRAVIG